MSFEKIIKREDGSRVKIAVRFWHGTGSKICWEFEAYTCQPGKRTFYNTVNSDFLEYRSLSMDNRVKYKQAKALEHATKEEINEALLEAWEKQKPQLL